MLLFKIFGSIACVCVSLFKYWLTLCFEMYTGKKEDEMPINPFLKFLSSTLEHIHIRKISLNSISALKIQMKIKYLLESKIF